MAPSAAPERFDPYRDFTFRVKWDGRDVAGIRRVGGLKRSTEVIEHREGGDPGATRKAPGRTTYEAITLEMGFTHDTEFETWANQSSTAASGPVGEVTPVDLRKDLLVEVYDKAGELVRAYKVYRAWVSEYQALPDLDADQNAVAIQTLKLENEGWERVDGTVQPASPPT